MCACVRRCQAIGGSKSLRWATSFTVSRAFAGGEWRASLTHGSWRLMNCTARQIQEAKQNAIRDGKLCTALLILFVRRLAIGACLSECSRLSGVSCTQSSIVVGTTLQHQNEVPVPIERLQDHVLAQLELFLHPESHRNSLLPPLRRAITSGARL